MTGHSGVSLSGAGGDVDLAHLQRPTASKREHESYVHKTRSPRWIATQAGVRSSPSRVSGTHGSKGAAPEEEDEQQVRFEGTRTQLRKGRSLFKMDCLKSIPMFKSCSPVFVEVLSEFATNEIFQDGQVIFHEGSHGDKMYVLQHGQVEVVISGNVVATLPAGSVFGEMAAMCKNPAAAKRNATIRAKGLVDCRVISRAALMHTTSNFPSDAKIIGHESERRLAELRAKGLLPDQRISGHSGVSYNCATFDVGEWRRQSEQLTRAARRQQSISPRMEGTREVDGGRAGLERPDEALKRRQSMAMQRKRSQPPELSTPRGTMNWDANVKEPSRPRESMAKPKPSTELSRVSLRAADMGNFSCDEESDQAYHEDREEVDVRDAQASSVVPLPPHSMPLQRAAPEAVAGGASSSRQKAAVVPLPAAPSATPRSTPPGSGGDAADAGRGAEQSERRVEVDYGDFADLDTSSRSPLSARSSAASGSPLSPHSFASRETTASGEASDSLLMTSPPDSAVLSSPRRKQSPQSSRRDAGGKLGQSLTSVHGQAAAASGALRVACGQAFLEDTPRKPDDARLSKPTVSYRQRLYVTRRLRCGQLEADGEDPYRAKVAWLRAHGLSCHSRQDSIDSRA